LVSEN